MTIRFTQAKVIGGGSSINARIYTRGNALDYDEWRQMGCDGWSYEDVLPSSVRPRTTTPGTTAGMGEGGPLGVSKPRAPLPICEAYFAAAAGARHPAQRRHDRRGVQDGAGYYQLTQRNARRSSAAVAYLRPPPRGEPDPADRRGGEAHPGRERPRHRRRDRLDGEPDRRGRREVILFSGAIGSPRMLMLSGIGPADHLDQVGIRPLSRQPGVGVQLPGPPRSLHGHRGSAAPIPTTRYARLRWSAVAGLQYLLDAAGPVASSLFETGGFWYADRTRARPTSSCTSASARDRGGGGGDAERRGDAELPMRPRSRGTVRLASADPAAAPLIDPNYWEDAHDREMSIRGPEARAGRSWRRRP